MCTCPECHGDTGVYDSRPYENGAKIWRRRKCSTCGYRFTTIEILMRDHEPNKSETQKLRSKLSRILTAVKLAEVTS